MFKGKHFYHQHIRKAIVSFGTIFNNILVEREDSNSEKIQTIRVPLSYATKQKFLTRIEQSPDTASRGGVALVLPRMGFEITSLNYDATRKVSPIQQHKKTISSNALSVNQQFVSTPYDLQISLYIFAKNQNDGLQILEQILPFFNPDFNITINDLPEMDIKRDIKIVLNDIGYEDNTAGAFADRQSIVWTLNFTLKINMYGHVSTQSVIRKAIANAYSNPTLNGARSIQTFTVTSAVATATATLSGDTVDSIIITYAGNGYTSVPNVTLTGNARAHAIMSEDGTSISSIVIDDAGSGYSEAPTVTIESPDDGNQTKDDVYRFLEEFDISYD